MLLVEDEPDIVESMRDLLARLAPGLEVVTAFNGHDAVAQLSRRPWGLFMVDYRLPDLDGVTVLKEARRVAPRAARVLVTAHGDARLDDRARGEAEVHAVLRKPFRREDLAQLLQGLPALGVRRLR